MEKYSDYSLLAHNTFGMDVLAERFIAYDTPDELIGLLTEEDWSRHTWMHIGSGSNILFCKDFEGTILFSRINDMVVEEESADEVTLSVGAGCLWDDLVAYTVGKGWGGCENLSGIPGQVGAAAIQNIGAYGAEAKDVIEWVEAIDVALKEVVRIPAIDCRFDYRFSAFKEEWAGKYIITRVIIKLKREPVLNLGYGDLRKRLKPILETATVGDVRKTIIDMRNEKLPDPAILGNAGSFFQNPYIYKSRFEELKEEYPDIPFYPVNDEIIKISAAWLIEKCGLKGLQVGKAQVCETQCLVLVNLGGASADDIVSLADAVYNEVANTFRIGLVEEVIYV